MHLMSHIRVSLLSFPWLKKVPQHSFLSGYVYVIILSSQQDNFYFHDISISWSPLLGLNYQLDHRLSLFIHSFPFGTIPYHLEAPAQCLVFFDRKNWHYSSLFASINVMIGTFAKPRDSRSGSLIFMAIKRKISQLCEKIREIKSSDRQEVIF